MKQWQLSAFISACSTNIMGRVQQVFFYGVLWGATGVTELWSCPCLEIETQESAKNTLGKIRPTLNFL